MSVNQLSLYGEGSGYDSRISGRSGSSRETCCIRSDGTRDSYSTSYCRSTIQWPGISLINFQDLRWMLTSLLHSRGYQYSIAKVYVFSDTVLCRWKVGDNPVESWKNQIQWYSDKNYFSELFRIDGKPMEFRVGDLPRIHNSGNPQPESTDDERITVWTRVLHRQDHIHVNV